MPVEVEGIAAAREAQRVLRAADYPCPEPLSGPDAVEGRVLALETLMGEGGTPDGRDPGNRRLLAGGLARHIALLRGRPDLLNGAGPGPSWCRYEAGPWPVPHDPIVDFSVHPRRLRLARHVRRGGGRPSPRPPRRWRGGRGSCRLVLRQRYGVRRCTRGHLRLGAGRRRRGRDRRLHRGLLRRELDQRGWALDAGGGGRVPARLRRPTWCTPTSHEQRAAAGAAAWILAFNARWDLGMRELGQAEGATLTLVREREDDYLAITW